MSNLRTPRSLASIFYLMFIGICSGGNIYVSKLSQVIPHYAMFSHAYMVNSRCQNYEICKKIKVSINCDGKSFFSV